MCNFCGVYWRGWTFSTVILHAFVTHESIVPAEKSVLGLFCTSQSIFLFFLLSCHYIKIFFWLICFERVMERQTDRGLPSARFTSQMATIPSNGPCQSQELHPSLPHYWQGPREIEPISAAFFPRPLPGSCIGNAAARTQTDTNTGCWCQVQLYLLHYNTNRNSFFFFFFKLSIFFSSKLLFDTWSLSIYPRHWPVTLAPNSCPLC